MESRDEHAGTSHWCVNGYGWCPGPDAPSVSGEAWGGKCAECACWPNLGATTGRYGWNQAYLGSGGLSP